MVDSRWSIISSNTLNEDPTEQMADILIIAGSESDRERVEKAGLSDRIDLRLYDPGPLPFGDEEFDIVFGKDSWIHIEDKRGFFAEIFRVLKPGGILAAGDWLRSDRPYDETYHQIGNEAITAKFSTPMQKNPRRENQLASCCGAKPLKPTANF